VVSTSEKTKKRKKKDAAIQQDSTEEQTDQWPSMNTAARFGDEIDAAET
jgi:hypothetical protein